MKRCHLLFGGNRSLLRFNFWRQKLIDGSLDDVVDLRMWGNHSKAAGSLADHQADHLRVVQSGTVIKNGIRSNFIFVVFRFRPFLFDIKQ